MEIPAKTFTPEMTVVVEGKGFFETTLGPKGGMAFRRNLICDVVFLPKYPKPPGEVIRAVGAKGQRLGFPENPQA